MTTAAALPVSGDFASSLRAWFELGKPRITSLVVLTTSVGALLAPASGGRPLLGIVVGTALVVAGANALNMYLERDTDAAMERTRHRPLPSGRLAPSVASWSGVAVSASGLVVLAGLVNASAAIVAAIALASYVLLYTPLKRITPWALPVGAVPGALPPVIGWVGAGGVLDTRAWSLFLLLYAWQIPHFLAISVFRETEYRRAGLAVMPAVHGLRATHRAIALSSALLAAVSVLPVLTGLASGGYLAVAVALGLPFVGLGVSGLRSDVGPLWARRVFFASLPYLVLVLATLLVDAAV